MVLPIGMPRCINKVPSQTAPASLAHVSYLGTGVAMPRWIRVVAMSM